VKNVTRIVLKGGDLNDKLIASTIAIPVTLDGGAGNDILSGGKKADIFSGGTGNDTMNTKDDVSDTSIVCGAGADTVNADLTPNETVAADCETVHRT
jgi:RTX toxin RtxA